MGFSEDGRLIHDQFGLEEYGVIVVMLVLSLIIGIYFTFWSRQDNYSEYMLGGRSMGVFPVAMSQVASHISGIAMVGNPAEVYSYGSLYTVVMISDLIVPFINIKYFLPIFYNLQLNSLYEYLELRFNHGARVLCSLIFTISQILYLPAIIYVPALVLNQVSGFPVHVLSPIICGICIFYTTFGGIKAVLWTDALQNMFSLVAYLFVMFIGVYRLGGFGEVHRVNEEGGRVEFFNMEISPFVRNSFWTLTIGNTMNWMCNLAVHPGAVQRSLSVPTLSKAKRALLWTAFGVTIVHGLTMYMGMVLYARYHDCDPVATGEVRKTGSIMPLYVMEITKGYPGLAGLFVSGVLSAALSSMSSALNTMAGSLYEDMVEFCFRGKKQSDAKQACMMKTISLLLGLFCTSLVFAVEKTDSIFQLGMSLYGVTNGALFTLFLLGIFVPKATAKGAIVGSVTSLVVMSWIIGHTYFYMSTGRLRYPGKFTSVDKCPGNFSTDPGVLSRLETWKGYSSPVVADGVPLLYQISYMYYSIVGTIVGVSVGLVVSLYCRSRRAPTHTYTERHLYSPLVHHLLPRPPSKTNSVRFAPEEEFKLITVPAETNEERHSDEGEGPPAGHQ